MPTASIIWTDDKVDELKRLWEAGGSCSEIGAELRITRSAVIGKVHRLGLAGRRVKLSEEVRTRRADKIRTRNEARQARGMILKSRERESQEPTLPVALPFIGSLNIPFGDLRPYMSGATNQCRFIAAEPAGPDYLACGNETLPGESWCWHCRGIVFRTDQTITDAHRNNRGSGISGRLQRHPDRARGRIPIRHPPPHGAVHGRT